MVIAPSALFSAVGLIAGGLVPGDDAHSLRHFSTRASYLDVARTLGANRLYLVFRVAIPAAMPWHLYRTVHGSWHFVSHSGRSRERRR